MANVAPVALGRRRRLGTVEQHEVDERMGEDDEAHGRGDDDGEDAPQPEGHASPEGHGVPVGPAGGERRGDRRHDRHGHDAVGQEEELVGVGVGRHRPRGGAIGQRQHDEEGHLVGQHEPKGPTGQPGDGAHRFVAGLPAELEVEIGPKQRRYEQDGLDDHPERGAEAEQDEVRGDGRRSTPGWGAARGCGTKPGRR